MFPGQGELSRALSAAVLVQGRNMLVCQPCCLQYPRFEAMHIHNSRVSIALVFILSLSALGCGVSDPPNGSLACEKGSQACPDGYYCSQNTNRCWKNGTAPVDDAGTSGLDANPATDGPSSHDQGASIETAVGETMVKIDTTRDTTAVDGISLDVIASVDLSVPDAPRDAIAGDVPVIDQGDVAGDLAGGGLGDVARDLALDQVPDAPMPDSAPDLSLPDATPDQPILQPDAAVTCASLGKVLCGTTCIDPPPTGCCAASDCVGACMTCGADHLCAPAKDQADPNGRCTGTCDATGTCKQKKGQTCQAQSECITGTSCSPDGVCCDRACTGSCEACDLSANPGTCTVLASGATPHPGHDRCVTTDATCAGTCDGSSGSCFYTTASCGSASCNDLVFTPAGACKSGVCQAGTAQTCANACSVASGGCTDGCTPDALKCTTSSLIQQCDANGNWKDYQSCKTNETCISAVCRCTAPRTSCPSGCVNTQTDANNCGGCGTVCSSGTCSAGVCQ
jgi:hypothetical protein